MYKIMTLMFILIVAGIMFNACLNAYSTQQQPANEPAQMQVVPNQIRASHILVKTKEEADNIRKQLLAGKTFEEMAGQYSLCPSGKSGGDLGYFPRGAMVPEFDQAAFSLPKDELSEPVQTQFGWHIIKVTDNSNTQNK